MPFVIVADWWAFLDQRTDGALGDYARGETAEDHPRVDRGGQYATSSIRNALLAHYPPASVDAFAPDENDADMLQHAGALAMFSLTSTGGSRSEDIVTDHESAQSWLSKVRSGTQPIESLTAATPAAKEEGGASGFVRWRGRERRIENLIRRRDGTE